MKITRQYNELKTPCPGPGRWNIVDHITHPGTPCFNDYYYESMEIGWNLGAIKVGLLSTFKVRCIDGFMYYQVNTDEKLIGKLRQLIDIREFWEDRLYLKAVDDWIRYVRPSTARRLHDLQNVKLGPLTNNQLANHIRQCVATTKEMVKVHHRFSCPTLVPMGDIIRQFSEWTGEDPSTVAMLLDVSHQDRRSAYSLAGSFFQFNEDPPVNRKAKRLLNEVKNGTYDATEFIESLRRTSPGLAQYVDNLLAHVGSRIIQGYDICSETIIERPDIVLQIIASSLNKDDENFQSKRNCEGLHKLRLLVPSKKIQVFESMLQDLKMLQLLRNERGLFSDLWSVGILRHAYLEAGRRLFGTGYLSEQIHILSASPAEVIGTLERQQPIFDPEELLSRDADRNTRRLVDAPETFGEWGKSQSQTRTIPDDVLRSEKSFDVAMSLAVDKPIGKVRNGSTFSGRGASRGIGEGPARLLKDGNMDAIRKGDVLVVEQSTASLSILLPILSGVVSENGGVLSHPAILAREYGIPCVVGCIGIFDQISPGDQLRVDGSAGTVQVS